VWVEIPCVFDKLKPEDEPDYASLGIVNSDDTTVEVMKINLDRIDGYTTLLESGKPEKTLFWCSGMRFWSALSYKEFDTVVKEKTIELNKMLGYYGKKV
jgi:hypothetical protein